MSLKGQSAFVLLFTGLFSTPLLKAEEGALAFFAKHCFECHDADSEKGDLNLEELSFDMNDPVAGELWNNIFAQVQFDEMPPIKVTERPAAAEKSEFLHWLNDELTLHGRSPGLEEKLLLPDYANLIDHQTLFDGSVEEMPYTPSRLWRQRPAIYEALWSNHYGKTPRLSIKIGSAARMDPRAVVKRGPHKGKTITTRYFNNSRFANPFYEFAHHASGFTDYASIRADQASLEALLTNSEKMAEILTVGLPVSVMTEVKNKDSRHGNNHGGFVGGVETRHIERRGQIPVVFRKIVDAEGTIERADFDAALDLAFRLLVKRTPDEAEADHYWTAVFQKNAELGNKLALQAVLIYITLSPEFVYRMEMGFGEPDEHGRRMLSPQELVYAIHHAFENTPPFGVDDFETVPVYTRDSEEPIQKIMAQGDPGYRPDGWLAQRMREGGLKTREDVEEVVRRILDTKQRNPNPNHNSPITSVTNSRILQFFREYFGYHKAPTVFKDTDKFTKIPGFQQYHNHTPHRMVYDTDALVLHILEEDRDVLRQLLTTNKVFVSYWNGTNSRDQINRAKGRDNYVVTHDAQSYNFDPFELEARERLEANKNGKGPYLAPENERCGILTQPSWLVSHSGNFDNDPVRRGKWIREKLLAGYTMDVPIDVDAQIPDDEHRTLRERFEVVEAEECWRCHIKMNPLGMPFESFNHVGRFRELELGKPVDASGAVTHTGVAEIEGEVDGVRPMMEKIASTDLARQSFIRHVFRFWMGRNEMLSDSKTLIAMDRAYVENDGSFKETLVTLLTSDSFLYRK